MFVTLPEVRALLTGQGVFLSSPPAYCIAASDWHHKSVFPAYPIDQLRDQLDGDQGPKKVLSRFHRLDGLDEKCDQLRIEN